MKCVVIPGDGIGPEVVRATQKILDASGAGFEWIEAEAGLESVARHGTGLPQKTIDLVAETKLAIKGPTTTPIGSGAPSANVALRKALDLYANLRPVRSLPNLKSRYENIDLVVVRENTEGLYSGVEHVVVPGVVQALKIITEKASTRIARFAFEYARKHGRKRVDAVHKANIQKLADGLFLDATRRVARDYPNIEFGDVIIDAVCMKLVINPYQFDTMVMENLYGDIISDLCAGLVGGLGVVPGANIGDDCAVFEAVHGSAPDIAGKGLANPTAVLQSGILMLRHVGKVEIADKVEKALFDVYRDGRYLTRDVGGTADTDTFTRAVIDAMKA